MRSERQVDSPGSDEPHLRSFADGWEAPTPRVITEYFNTTGLSSQQLANLLGVSDGRQVRAWKSGESAMRYATWRYFLLRLGVIELEP